MEYLFFDNFEKLLRIVLTSIFVYALVVLNTKIFGKRSTSQLNNFDWIVTVMIGSIGASTILLKNIPFIEGAASILTLYFLQFCMTKAAASSTAAAALILSDPKIVFYQGQFLPDVMNQERLCRQEIECAMRSEGINDFNDVEAVVFESDAKLTVIPKADKVKQKTETDGVYVSDTVDTLM